MTNSGRYPWFDTHWEQLVSLRQQSRLPHAIILKSVDGLGLVQLADNLAKSVLCKTPTDDGYACNQCRDCGLLAADTHPDYHYISVLDDKKYISIEQIRALVNITQERPHQGGYRVAVIDPIETLNDASANALLKTLEEPGSDTLIILVANNNLNFPATINSRCQLKTILSPTEQQGLDWLVLQPDYEREDMNTLRVALRLSSHAPLKAMNLLSSDQFKSRNKFLKGMSETALGRLDPEKLAASVGKNDILDSINWMYSLSLDALKLTTAVSKDSLTNFDHFDLLESLASRNPMALNRWSDQIMEAKRLFTTTSNITPQLILEDLLFRWIAIFR